MEDVSERSIGSSNTGGGADDDDDDSTQASDDDAIPLPSVLGPYDEGRMSIGKTERVLAQQIKAAVEQEPELEPLSDFMYAQLAIATLGECPRNMTQSHEDLLPDIMERVHNLQALRQEYCIQDTVAQGRQVMQRAIFDLLPGWFIAFSYHSEKGSYLRVCSITKFDMSMFTNQEKVRTWLAAVWYINHAHIPDLEAARQGFVQFVECKGYDWRNQSMLNIKAFTKAVPSFALYPILCRQTIHYNTGMFVKMFTSMIRRMLPKHMTEGFEFEAGCEHGQLDEIFGMPNQEVANQRLITRLEDALRRRYQNEANFRLGDDDGE